MSLQSDAKKLAAEHPELRRYLASVTKEAGIDGATSMFQKALLAEARTLHSFLSSDDYEIEGTYVKWVRFTSGKSKTYAQFRLEIEFSSWGYESDQDLESLIAARYGIKINFQNPAQWYNPPKEFDINTGMYGPARLTLPLDMSFLNALAK